MNFWKKPDKRRLIGLLHRTLNVYLGIDKNMLMLYNTISMNEKIQTDKTGEILDDKEIPTIELGSLKQTFEIEGAEDKIQPGASLKINGFLAEKRNEPNKFLVSINQEAKATVSDADTEARLGDAIRKDDDFVLGAYYNLVARGRGMTLPDATSMTSMQMAKFKELGFHSLPANGSLEELETDGHPKGLVLSRGNQLPGGLSAKTIERRAAEIGLYSIESTAFPNGDEEKCIVATDSVGNRVLMLYSEDLEKVLCGGFGYEKVKEGEMFDVQEALSSTYNQKTA